MNLTKNIFHAIIDLLSGVMVMEKFQKVYPFTTENISLYMNEIDMSDKSVLTVGSSLDQTFNAILKGASDVTVLDVNKKTKNFFELKKDLLLNSNGIEQFYRSVINVKKIPLTRDEIFSLNVLKRWNYYLSSVENFRKLQSMINDSKIKFVTGSIYDIDSILPDEMYDVMILSNVLQYIEGEDIKKAIRDSFENFVNHLNINGILQFMYIYGFSYNNKIDDKYSVYDVIDTLSGYVLEKASVDKDAALLYTRSK